MITYHPELNPNLIKYGIQVPMLDSRVEKAVRNLNIQACKLSEVEPLTKEDLLLAHDPHFVERLFDEKLGVIEVQKCYELIDEQGNPHRYDPEAAEAGLSDLRDKLLLQGGGSLKAARTALNNGIGYFLGGGFHHAMKDCGRGFCLFHDVLVVIKKLQQEGEIKTAWVIDVDAHKGDGTAAMAADDPSIQTLSIHMASSWPLDGVPGDGPWWTPSDLDIPLEEGEESFYLSKLEDGLNSLKGNPDLVFVIQGADPYEEDALPSTQKMKLSLSELMKRDEIVYRFLKKRNIPQAYVMAGGYGEESYRVYEQFLRFLREEGHAF